MESDVISTKIEYKFPMLFTTKLNGAARNDVIALMMEVVRTSETSVSLYQTTWRIFPEDSHHHSFHTC
jgi:putative lipoic acid-binding regulatory protein